MLKVLLLGMITFLFSGCMGVMSVSPSYDKEKKVLSLGNLKLPNVTSVRNGYGLFPVVNSNIVTTNLASYKISDSECREILVFNQEAVGNVYFRENALDLVKKHNKKFAGDGCTVEKEIGINKFVTCGVPGGYTYYITYSLGNEYGKDNLTVIKLNKKCYNYVKAFLETESRGGDTKNLKSKITYGQDNSHFKSKYDKSFYDKKGCNIVGYNKFTKKYDCLGNLIISPRFEVYRNSNTYKAFAIAVAKTGLVQGVGMVVNSDSQEKANKIALEKCTKERNYFKKKAECKLLAIGDNFIKY